MVKTKDSPEFSMDPTMSFVHALPGTKAKIGKHHLAGKSNLLHVNACGYGHFDGTLFNLQNIGSGTYYNWQRTEDGQQTWETTYATSYVGAKAMEMIDTGVDFLSVDFHAPHKPYDPPPPGMHSYGDLTGAEEHIIRLAMLEAVDDVLDRVAAYALDMGYLVFITSDNGSVGEAEKGTMYEKGLRVPLIALGENVRVGYSNAYVDMVDFGATISEIMGGSPVHPDSQSFAWDLFGTSGTPRQWMYTQKYRKNGKPNYEQGKPFTWGMRLRYQGGQYKVIRSPNDASKPDEVYDLETDFEETTNLASTRQDVIAAAEGMRP